MQLKIIVNRVEGTEDSKKMSIEIKRATEENFEEIYKIFLAILLMGDSYVNRAEMTRQEVYDKWMAKNVETYVAMHEGVVVGCYLLKTNREGYGNHVANASYIVSPEFRRIGIGRADLPVEIHTKIY